MKNPVDSKTLWTNLLLALTALYVPKLHAYLVANPDMIIFLFAGVNGALRFLSKEALSLGIPISFFNRFAPQSVVEAAVVKAVAADPTAAGLPPQTVVSAPGVATGSSPSVPGSNSASGN